MSSVSSDSGQSSSSKPTSGFVFSQPPSANHGPETVVNPGHRELISDAQKASFAKAPESAILKQLFPPEFPTEEEGPLEEPTGVTLGHFVIEARIGTGGMGSVFLAKDSRLDRTVALKVLSPGLSRDRSSVLRFQNEAQAAARLDHENVARVFYFGEDRGLHFIAYEYITGINVRDRIRQKGRLDPGEAVTFTLQIASALNHTSSAGIVHRDIKPSNIIITPTGRAKLVDLGLARKQSDDDSNELTTAGTTLGTFDYISPEQAKDPRNVDVRSDLYSLGCTLYHMLAGEPPYPEGTVLQKLLDHQGTDPPDPCKKNRRVPPALGVVVQKMMASDPRKRYATPDDLTRDLMPFVGKMVLRDLGPAGLVWASSEPRGSRFWERHLGWMASTAVLLLIVFGISRFPSGLTSPADIQSSNNSFTPPKGTGIEGGGISPSTEENHEPITNTTKARSRNKFLDVDDIFGSSDPAIKKFLPDVFPEMPLGPVSPDGSSLQSSLKAVVENLPPVEALRPAGIDPGNTVARTPVEPRQPSISIVSSDGEVTSYRTLEGACHKSKDGDIIEINYNGRIPVSAEKPLKVTNKDITIRAGKDGDGNRYRPLIEFAPETNYETETVSMLTLLDGSVKFINVNFLMKIDSDMEMESDGKYAFFVSQGVDAVRLIDVLLTIENPRSEFVPATVFELASGAASSRGKTMMMNTDQTKIRPEFHFEVTNGFVRGGCHFFSSRHARPGRLEIENSVVAIDRSLLNILGDEEEEASDNSSLEMRLEHVTCLTGDGFLKMNSGNNDFAGDLVPIAVTARNNIFATNSSNSFVSMYGNTDVQDFQKILRRWDGGRNYYGPFDMFWIIKQDPSAEPEFTLDYRDWKRFWEKSDTEANFPGTSVLWLQKETWQQKSFSQVLPDDLKLEPDAELNPAILGADDDTNAGAELKTFQKFFAEKTASADDE